jgi:hypothetical protein
MRKWQLKSARLAVAGAIAMAVALVTTGCGVAYQVGTKYRAHSMKDSLKVGESSLAIHKEWGEPDIRTNIGTDGQVWSYAERANANDVAATIFYTSAKEGDRGKFLDLKFVDGKLESWADAEHTMPSKQGTGFSYGLPVNTSSGISHY